MKGARRASRVPATMRPGGALPVLAGAGCPVVAPTVEAVAVREGGAVVVGRARSLTPSDQEVVEALHAARGIVNAACDRLGCSPAHLHQRLRDNPELAAARLAARRRVTDRWLERVAQGVELGDPTCLALWARFAGWRDGLRTERGAGDDDPEAGRDPARRPVDELADEELLAIARGEAREAATVSTSAAVPDTEPGHVARTPRQDDKPNATSPAPATEGGAEVTATV